MSKMKIVLTTSLAVVVIVCLFVGIDLAFAVAMTTTGYFMGLPWMAEISVLWLILAFWVLPKDWMAINRAYTCRGSAIVAAPIEQVWDAILPRPRTENYRPVVSRITADLTDHDRFYFHFDPRLSGEGTGHPERVAVQVTDKREKSYLRIEYPQTNNMPGWSKDLLCSEVFLEPGADGVTVTFAETLRRLSVPTLFSLMFLNPCRDSAMGLKTWVEGTEDTSWIGRYMNGIGPDGSPPEDMRSGVLVASLTALVVLAGILVGIGSFVVFALPDG